MPESPEDIQHTLREARAQIEAMPDMEREVALLAANGTPIEDIAARTGHSEETVWRTLHRIVSDVTGQRREPVETGGLGADTDPGVSGGYGDTGFGALDTEPPIAGSDEPEEEEGYREGPV